MLPNLVTKYLYIVDVFLSKFIGQFEIDTPVVRYYGVVAI